MGKLYGEDSTMKGGSGDVAQKMPQGEAKVSFHSVLLGVGSNLKLDKEC